MAPSPQPMVAQSPNTYAAVVAAAGAATEQGRSYCYQDDLDVICEPAVAAQTEAAFVAACAQVGLRANPTKTKLSPGRLVDVAALPAHPEVEPRALVLRHGALPAAPGVPVAPAAQPAHGSMLAEGSPEVARLAASRARVYSRLRELRAAGLDAQQALALLRARTSSDYTFIARTCGIPTTEARALDAALLAEVQLLRGRPLD